MKPNTIILDGIEYDLVPKKEKCEMEEWLKYYRNEAVAQYAREGILQLLRVAEDSATTHGYVSILGLKRWCGKE